MFDIFNDTGARQIESIISTAYHAALTLMVFQLLPCLSSPNFPSSFAVLFFYINQSKVKFADHYAIMKQAPLRINSLHNN